MTTILVPAPNITATATVTHPVTMTDVERRFLGLDVEEEGVSR